MSSFDENIAELRGIRENTEDTANATSFHQTSAALSSNNPLDSSSRQSIESNLERQPLFNHTLTDSSPLTPPRSVAPETSTHSHADVATDIGNESPEYKGCFANMPGNLFFTLSTVYGASAVALGAFGAHGLKKRISDPARVANWSTAAQYQLIHSVALLATSIALPQRAQRIPGTLFLAGMTMFSGSIYLLVIDPARFKALGPVTPLGGLCLIGGWIGLGIVGRRFVR